MKMILLNSQSLRPAFYSIWLLWQPYLYLRQAKINNETLTFSLKIRFLARLLA